MQTAVLLNEPTPLDNGKTILAQFAVCRKAWTTLRQSGHQGPAIEQYIFDRAGQMGMCNIFYAWHNLILNSDELPSDELRPKNLLELTEFFVESACSLHDAQKAIQWCHPAFANRDLIGICHITIESVRNSMRLT